MIWMISKKSREYQDTFNNVFVVDDLQNLGAGGRLSNASFYRLNSKDQAAFDNAHAKLCH